MRIGTDMSVGPASDVPVTCERGQQFSLGNQISMRMRSIFVRDVLYTYLTQIASLIISVCTTVIVARVLGPAGRGDFAVAAAIGLIGVQACNLGLHSSNTYFVAKKPHLLPSLLSNSILVSLGLGGLFASIVGVAFRIWPKFSPISGPLFGLSLLWVPLGLLLLLIENLLMGIHEVAAFNVLEFGRRVVGLFFIVVAALVGTRSPAGLFLAMLVGLAATNLLGLGKIRTFINSLPHPSLAQIGEGFSIGLRAYLAALFAFLVIRADLLMVKYILGSVQAGYYSVAGSLADYLLLLPGAIGFVLFPKLSAATEGSNARAWAKKVTLAGAAVFLPVILLTALAAHLIIHILFGDSFQPASWALILLMPGVFFLGVQTIMVQYLNSLGFPLSVVWSWLATFVVNICTNLWAIPRYGIAGASLVSSICYFLMFVLVWFIFQFGTASKESLPELSPA
jgi:O-antigen/teichoic acid export membrane protein